MSAMTARLRLFRMENECMTCFFIQSCAGMKNPAVTEVTESSCQLPVVGCQKSKFDRGFARMNTDRELVKKPDSPQRHRGHREKQVKGKNKSTTDWHG